MQDNTGLEELSQAQRERLAHIDFTLLFKGEAGRSYLTERFSVAPSVATQDFARYKALAPNNVMYDEKRRVHLKTSTFQPLFDYDIVRTLATMAFLARLGHLWLVKHHFISISRNWKW